MRRTSTGLSQASTLQANAYDNNHSIQNCAYMPQTISTRLQAARKKAGLSQAQAAEKWRINKRTLESWEQGLREPRGLALVTLEKILSRIERE